MWWLVIFLLAYGWLSLYYILLLESKWASSWATHLMTLSKSSHLPRRYGVALRHMRSGDHLSLADALLAIFMFPLFATLYGESPVELCDVVMPEKKPQEKKWNCQGSEARALQDAPHTNSCKRNWDKGQARLWGLSCYSRCHEDKKP